jgi:hypothetical protein
MSNLTRLINSIIETINQFEWRFRHACKCALMPIKLPIKRIDHALFSDFITKQVSKWKMSNLARI